MGCTCIDGRKVGSRERSRIGSWDGPCLDPVDRRKRLMLAYVCVCVCVCLASVCNEVGREEDEAKEEESVCLSSSYHG